MLWSDKLCVFVGVVLLLLIFCAVKGKEGYVSQRAKDLSAQASDFFRGGHDSTTFQRFKFEIKDPENDAILYSKIRDLHVQGKLTPDNVQKEVIDS